MRIYWLKIAYRRSTGRLHAERREIEKKANKNALPARGSVVQTGRILSAEGGRYHAATSLLYSNGRFFWIPSRA